jgi:hypothetical protein
MLELTNLPYKLTCDRCGTEFDCRCTPPGELPKGWLLLLDWRNDMTVVCSVRCLATHAMNDLRAEPSEVPWLPAERPVVLQILAKMEESYEHDQDPKERYGPFSPEGV